MRPDPWRSMPCDIEARGPAQPARPARISRIGRGADRRPRARREARQCRTAAAFPARRRTLVAIDRARRGRPALRQARRLRGRRHQAQRAVAHRRHRILHQLFAAAGSARHHHAERPVLRAPSCRPAGRRSGPAPADDPWPGRAPAGSHDEGHRAFSVGVAHPFHRMPGQWRHGVARRAIEFAAIQPRHDQLRGMDRGEAVDAAGRSRASRRRRNGRWSRAPTARI